MRKWNLYIFVRGIYDILVGTLFFGHTETHAHQALIKGPDGIGDPRVCILTLRDP